MMPRDASLSDSYKSNHCCFSLLTGQQCKRKLVFRKLVNIEELPVYNGVSITKLYDKVAWVVVYLPTNLARKSAAAATDAWGESRCPIGRCESHYLYYYFDMQFDTHLFSVTATLIGWNEAREVF